MTRKFVNLTLSAIALAALLLSGNVYSAVTCTPIPKTPGSNNFKITETDGGIFSLESFDDDLYIGMFGYDYDSTTGNDRMIWRYNGTSISAIDGFDKNDLHYTPNDSGSESICALKAWGNYLYAGSEREGKLFRKSTHSDFWQSLGNFNARDVCDFEIGKNANGNEILVAPETHDGKILYSADGLNWNTKIIISDGNPSFVDPYFRESIYFKGEWFVFGKTRNIDGNIPIAFKKSNLTSSGAWTNISSSLPLNPNPGRIFRTNIIKGKLWAGTGYNANDKVGLLKFNGASFIPTYAISSSVYSHINKPYHVMIGGEERIIATASTGWKPRDSNIGHEGDSFLLSFDIDGKNPLPLCTFSGQEYADATVFHNGDFYVGTMHRGYESISNRGGGYGRLYKIGGITEVQSSIKLIEYEDYLIPIIN